MEGKRRGNEFPRKSCRKVRVAAASREGAPVVDPPTFVLYPQVASILSKLPVAITSYVMVERIRGMGENHARKVRLPRKIPLSFRAREADPELSALSPD